MSRVEAERQTGKRQYEDIMFRDISILGSTIFGRLPSLRAGLMASSRSTSGPWPSASKRYVVTTRRRLKVSTTFGVCSSHRRNLTVVCCGNVSTGICRESTLHSYFICVLFL